MEADTVHANIGTTIKAWESQRGLYTPQDVTTLIRSLTKGAKYEARNLTHQDKRQYNELMEDMAGKLTKGGFAGIGKMWLLHYRKVLYCSVLVA